MAGLSTKAEHALRQSYPPFLSLLRSDPGAAFKGFHRFTWRLLLSNPPSILRSLRPELREDVIAEVIYHCWRDNQRVLRAYRDQGRPFAAWLLVVARRKALDLLRREPPEALPLTEEPRGEGGVGPLPHPGPNPSRVADVRRLLSIAARCIERMNNKCRLLLWGSAQGYRPKELSVLLGWGPNRNKKASDDLRECRRDLKKLLMGEGIDWQEAVSLLSEA